MLKKTFRLAALIMASILVLTGCMGESWIYTEDYTKDKKMKTWSFSNMNAMPENLAKSVMYTYDDVRKAVAKNETITEEYSDYFYKYLDLLEKAYPDMNLFCLYRNMETLKLDPCTEKEMILLFGDNRSGNYKAGNNALYFNFEWSDNCEYLLFHEMSHMVTNYWGKQKGYSIYFDFDRHGDSFAVEEGLNSIFLENIIGYTVDYMSYQIPANHLRVMLEYSDHDLEEILTHDTWYFEDILAETFPGIGSGMYNAALMNQMKDSGFAFNGYDLDMDYADYYTGILYFSNNLKSGMGKEEIISVYETLVGRLTENVASGPSTTYIHDFSDLQTALFETISEIGISEEHIPDVSELTGQYEFPRRPAGE